MREAIVSSIRRSIRQAVQGSGGSPAPAFKADLTSSTTPNMALTVVTPSYTRATSATYVDDDGIIQTVSSGVARHTSKGILIEGARTNVLTYSDDFTNWTNVNSVDVANYATGADGGATATRLIDDVGGGTGTVYVTRAVTLATTTQYTAYAIAKKDQLDWLALELNGFTGAVAFAYFNLDTGAIGATTGAANDSESIKLIGNGWYLCSVTFTTAADGVGAVRAYASSGDNVTTVDIDGTSSILLWGAQVEAGSFPSSYIPTTTTSAGRDADVGAPSYSAAGNAESLPLTLSLEFTPTAVHEATLTSVNDDTADQRVSIYLAADNTMRAYMETVTAQANVSSATTITAGTTYKVTAVFAENDVEIYVDGVSEGTPDVSATAASGFTTINIGENVSELSHFYGYIRNVQIFNKRLSAAEVAAL